MVTSPSRSAISTSRIRRSRSAAGASRTPGSAATINQSLEKVQRVDDFFELGELMCRDALHREESCGGHFREEHQTPEGEALRDHDSFAYAAAWEWTGPGSPQELNKEPLEFEYVQLTQRSYK